MKKLELRSLVAARRREARPLNGNTRSVGSPRVPLSRSALSSGRAAAAQPATGGTSGSDSRLVAADETPRTMKWGRPTKGISGPSRGEAFLGHLRCRLRPRIADSVASTPSIGAPPRMLEWQRRRTGPGRLGAGGGETASPLPAPAPLCGPSSARGRLRRSLRSADNRGSRGQTGVCARQALDDIRIGGANHELGDDQSGLEAAVAVIRAPQPHLVADFEDVYLGERRATKSCDLARRDYRPRELYPPDLFGGLTWPSEESAGVRENGT